MLEGSILLTMHGKACPTRATSTFPGWTCSPTINYPSCSSLVGGATVSVRSHWGLIRHR